MALKFNSFSALDLEAMEKRTDKTNLFVNYISIKIKNINSNKLMNFYTYSTRGNKKFNVICTNEQAHLKKKN